MWEVGNQKPRKKNFMSNEDMMKIKGSLDEREAKLLFYQFLRNNITYTADLLMGVELFPFQHILIKSILESDYSLAVLSRGLSKCVVADALVTTNNGTKRIIDVEVGEKILAKDNYQLVEAKTVNPAEKTYRVVTQKGYESEGLDYHRVLVLKKDLSIDWAHSKDLKKGDCLVMRKNSGFLSSGDVFNEFESSKKEPFEGVVLPTTEDQVLNWYYFLGLSVGGGYFGGKSIKISTIESDILEFLKVFGPSIGVKANIYGNPSGPAKYGILASRPLSEFLTFCGFSEKTKSENRFIPTQLLNSTEDNIKMLLRGIFDSSSEIISLGSSKRNKAINIKLTSNSLFLIKQVRFLLLQLGIVSQTKEELSGGAFKLDDRYYNCKKSWSITINSYDNVLKFCDKIGSSIKKNDEVFNQIRKTKYKFGQSCDIVPYVGDFFRKYFGCKAATLKVLDKNVLFEFKKSLTKTCVNQILNHIDEPTFSKVDVLLDNNIFFDFVDRVEEGNAITVDLQVAREHCYVSDGFINHNSFSSAICAGLDAALNQGVHIGILGPSYRQSKIIFKYLEDISKKPGAYLFAQCITRITHSTDQWHMQIGRSSITALPLGDGEKLRGQRFQRIYIDEALLMQERIVTEVLGPFLSVITNPQERQSLHDLESRLIAKGEMKEEDRYKWPSNKLICLSSASYKFEYLYKLYQQYEKLIDKPGKDVAHRCIIQLAYDCAPTQLYDQNQINQAKATMSEAQFNREYGAQFTDESNGYFSVKKIAACSIPEGESPSVEVQGDPNSEYIVSIDPSWAETSTSDDFAIQVLKIDSANKITTLVHSYAVSGLALRDHINYFHYILTNFNVVAICFDYNGGQVFMNAANESELFKSSNINLKIIETEFDKPEEYNDNLIAAKNQYNKTNQKIVFMRKPLSAWIRSANELLQSSLDHRKIFFASPAIDGQFRNQYSKSIDVLNLQYRRKTAKEESLDQVDWEEGAQKVSCMIDFLEHIYEMVHLTKTQLGMIMPTTSAQGVQSFDVPKELKGSGRDRTRKDSYSALVLGNWISKIYFDLQNVNAEVPDASFTPILV